MSLAAVGTFLGVGSMLLGAKAQGDANDQMDKSNQLLDRQVELSEEQWDNYKTNILPLEIEASELGVTARELAVKRGEKDLKLYEDFYMPLREQMATMASEGVKDQTERVTREAAETVSGQFERAKDVNRRDMERRGVRPDDGSHRTNNKMLSLAEAGSRSEAINDAREDELDRQENLKFSRLSSAISQAPGSPAPTQSAPTSKVNPNSAMYGLSNAANTTAGNARSYASDAGDIVQGGLSLAFNAARLDKSKPANPDADVF